MAINASYDQDGRLTLTGLDCTCGLTHRMPDQDIYVGTGLAGRLPELVRRRGLGRSAVLVADNVTYPLAAQQVESSLLAAGYRIERCLIERQGEMEPDERAAGELLLTLQQETDWIISVGSGSLTDIARIVAVRTGKPFVSFATAPSMDGYTSVVAPLLLRNAKIHRPAVCPDIIVCDLDVLRTAPVSMVISGVGDVLGKYIALADWQLGHIILDEPYCPACADLVSHALGSLVSNISAIRSRSEAGIRILIEALLLAGVTTMIIGHTRAVASIEHNMVHYWDMMKLQNGQKQPPHGSAVGLSTWLIWPFYVRFMDEDLTKLDFEDIRSRRLSRRAREQRMLSAYGTEAGQAIMRENPEDFLTWSEQAGRISRARDRFSEIRSVIQAMPSLVQLEITYRELGAPVHPEELDIDDQLLARSLLAAKDYRSRYSLFKLLDECGLLESYIRELTGLDIAVAAM